MFLLRWLTGLPVCLPAVVCKNLQDGTYTRYAASKGVILASGDYSYNDEMLQKYAPWVYAHKDNYLFSHEGMDREGNHASTGDGHKFGISVGGHLDIAPMQSWRISSNSASRTLSS